MREAFEAQSFAQISLRFVSALTFEHRFQRPQQHFPLRRRRCGKALEINGDSRIGIEFIAMFMEV